MTRLTKSEIENRLLAGEGLEWKDTSNKKQKLRLSTAKSRRLFEYLLASKVRTPTGLPVDFVNGLATTLAAKEDPADKQAGSVASISASAWWLDSLKSEGFGGINIYGGPAFEYDFDGDSWLAEGPNGSGKSSILGAIIWAMTGTRPRDHLDITAEDQRPVYSLVGADETEKLVGNWPPIAAYPTSIEDLKLNPKVSVTLTFKNQDGDKATVARTLENGKVTYLRSEGFSAPPILIEAGLLMPARLATIKFGDGQNQLATSVQRLTGLDDLIALGLLCEGLCNKAREYLTYKKKELSSIKQDFETALSDAKGELVKIDRKLPEFETKDTDQKDGELANLGKELTEKSAELTKVISGDLNSTLDLNSPKTHQEISAAIVTAKEDVEAGLKDIAYWKTLGSISSNIDNQSVLKLKSVLQESKQNAVEAQRLYKRTQEDTKFQLKAVAASWHNLHDEGDMEKCPLCTAGIKGSGLADELNSLKNAGEAASRTFADNLLSIMSGLNLALPVALRNLGVEILDVQPKLKLQSELRNKFAANPKHSTILERFRGLTDASLGQVPQADLLPSVFNITDENLKDIDEKIAIINRILDLKTWFDTNQRLLGKVVG